MKSTDFRTLLAGRFAAIRTCLPEYLIFINKNKEMAVFCRGTGLALQYRDNHYIQR